MNHTTRIVLMIALAAAMSACQKPPAPTVTATPASAPATPQDQTGTVERTGPDEQTGTVERSGPDEQTGTVERTAPEEK